jgi:Rrf2 family protein
VNPSDYGISDMFCCKTICLFELFSIKFVNEIKRIYSMSFSLSFSKSIMVVIFVADKMQQGQLDFLSTSSIAEVLNIPKPTLVKILQGLTADGIIETKEGKQGGVRLVKHPAKVSILDVLNAVEKGKSLFHKTFDMNASGKRPEKAQKAVTRLFNESEIQMKKVLKSKTIADILEEMN